MARATGFRKSLLLGVSLALAGGPAFAQTGTQTQSGSHARPAPKPQAQKSQSVAAKADQTGAPHTLAQALVTVYLNQPILQSERAKLRATDEDVPQALAGWKPTVVVAGSAGYGNGVSRQYLSSLGPQTGVTEAGKPFFQGGYEKLVTQRDIGTAQATVTQPLYTGGKVRANVNRATDTVMAERANLLAQEESSFANAINAYVGVIEARQILALDRNNEAVLREQLRATNDQYRVGEVTRTDVAQAEAALASAVALSETAQGQLQTAAGTFVQIIGYIPPDDLVPPQPLVLPVKGEREAAVMSSANNPAVIAARFNDSAAKNAVEAAFAALLPQVSLQGQMFQSNNSGTRSDSVNGYEALLNVSVPLYQGGQEYSAVRQARQTEQQDASLIGDAQRTAVQDAVNAWETLVAARATAASTQTAIRANEIALVGVEREHLVGTRTTLDVLNAQQTLLSSQVTLVQNLANLVTASYGVASAIGRLTARDLNLPVPLYDDTEYYKEVRNKWVGIGVPKPDAFFGH